MALVLHEAEQMALVIFEYPGTANPGVKGNSRGDFSDKATCGFGNRIIRPISQSIAGAHGFLSIFHGMTFRVCLQILAELVMSCI